jgi:hypothetical protein
MRAQQKGDMFAVVWIRHLESFFVRFKKSNTEWCEFAHDVPNQQAAVHA